MPKYDNYDYNTMGFGSDPLKQSDDGTPSSVLGAVDDAVGYALFGDADASSKIFGELTGYNKQQREFAQQEYMQDKTWQHDSAAAQMARAKAAGINLNTAAAGVAGSGNSSTVAVPSGGGSPAAAVDSVAGVVGAMSNSKLNAASAENQSAQAENTRKNTQFVPLLANGQNMKYFSDFVQGMKDVGLAEINAGGIAFDMMSGGLKKALDYLGYCSGLRNVDTQIKNVKMQFKLMQKDYETYDLRMNSNLSLQEKQGLKAAADAAKAQAEAWYQQQKNSIEESLKGSTMLQGASYLNFIAWEYGVDSPQFEAAEKGFYHYAYQSNLGLYSAEVDKIYDRMRESKLAENMTNAEFAQYLKDLELYGEEVKSLINLRYSTSGNTFNRIVSMMNLSFDQQDDWFSDKFGHEHTKKDYQLVPKPVLPHYDDMRKRKK